VKPERAREFERLQKELSALSHEREPGLVVYDVIKHRTEPSTYIVYARFRTDEDFQTHMKIDFHARLVPDILACLSQEMDLQFFDWVS
jgi:quinol monooxygenase YgiN